MRIDDLLTQLSRVRKSGAGWTALCPGHPDKNPSLSVTEGDDHRILMNCFYGCTVENICAALTIRVSGLFSGAGDGNVRKENAKAAPPRTKAVPPFEGTEQTVDEMQAGLVRNRQCQEYIERRGISLKVATSLKWGFMPCWSFRDDEGKTVRKPGLAIPHYVNERLVGIKFRTIDNLKLFSQVPGSVITGLYGAELLDRTTEEVLVLEGPEDCALAISYGWNATAINSASTHRLNRSDVKLLCRYKRIYLVGDHDIAGVKTMNEVGAQLPPEKVIRFPSYGYKDVGDLWRADPQNFAERLRRILRLARASRNHFELDDLLSEDELRLGAPVDRYVVERLVPLNGITMFFSEEKGGKSTLVTYISKCVANKLPVFGKYQTLQMPVVVMDLEATDNDITEYLQYFKDLGPNKIRYFTRSTGVPALDSPALIEICKRWRPLILIESFTKFASRESGQGVQTDVFHPGHVSRFFDKLHNLCAAGATILMTHHSTRADAERYADSHQIGAAVVRAYAVISRDRPKLKRVRLECKLARGAEPVSENLIAFPVIAQTGHFGLEAPSNADMDRLLGYLAEQAAKGQRCKKEDVKRGLKMNRNRVVELIDVAVKTGIVEIQGDGFLALPLPQKSVLDNSIPIFDENRTQEADTDNTSDKKTVIN